MPVRKRKSVRTQWVERSRAVRSLVDHCVVCFAGGDDVRLVVHHLRYRGARGTNERPEDLVVICSDCHDEIHRRKLDGPAKFRAFRDQMRAFHPIPARRGVFD
jgi:5-methylcytosine-specific restriction endonuclease McrA